MFLFVETLRFQRELKVGVRTFQPYSLAAINAPRRFGVAAGFYYQFKTLPAMNYITRKNERLARRNALFLTILITLTLAMAAAYFGGAAELIMAEPAAVDAVAVQP